MYFYQPDTRRDEPVIRALTELAERYQRYGFKKLFQLLRRQGNTWNHKRVSVLTLKNREKTRLVDALKEIYPVAELLSALQLARSCYFYHKASLRLHDVRYRRTRRCT